LQYLAIFTLERIGKNLYRYKTFSKNILIGIFTLILLFLSISTTSKQQEVTNIKQEITSQENLLLEKMSIEQKIGQLFLFGFPDKTISTETIALIQEKHIGGILILGYNIESNTQLKKLISDIQSYSDIPLFVSIDQEGGTVARLKENTILTIAQKDITDENHAFTIAKERGKLLKDLGINMNFAPVIENATNTEAFMYQRVFRGDSEYIAKMAKASIQGYTDSQIISVAKHYPGHGNSISDSHQTLPSILITDNQWEEYTYPFKYIIEEEVGESIMIGHILFPNIDSNPSTISYEILNKKLRIELNFNGVLITDDMLMKSLEDIGEYEEVAKQSLQAGSDILIYSGLPDVQNKVYEYILQAVENGEIDKEDINEKVLRILKLKIKYNIIDASRLLQKKAE
jgi:beta-N-acetylhexosaminidase